jgi:recombination protein RecA
MPKPAVSANVPVTPPRDTEGVARDNAEGSRLSDVELSPDEEAVLIGTVLGDGALAMHGHQARLFVKHKTAHRALAEFKRVAFSRFTSMRLHEFDQRLRGKRYPCVQFVTRTHPVFTAWRRRFYEGGRKIVPIEVSELLTPLATAVWFMDDGSADHTGVTLQTHSFTELEVRRLRTALSERFDAVATVRENKRRSILYIGKRELPRFAEIIRPYLLSVLEYKLVPRRSLTP